MVVNILFYQVLRNKSTCKLWAFSRSDLKLQLRHIEEEHALKEINMRESITSLSKEKDKLLCLSVERGKVIQVIEKSICSCL